MKFLACHGLRLDSRRCRLYEAKLHLLDCGRIKEATELEEELGRAIHDAAVKVLDHPHARLSGTKPTPEDVARASAATDDLLTRKLSVPFPRPPHVETSHERSLRRALLKEIQTACNSCKKCGSCGAMSPKARHDALNKVLLSALSDTGVKSNMAEGIEIGSALAVDAEEDGEEGRGGEDSVGPAAGDDRWEEEEDRRPPVIDEAEEEEEDAANFGRKKREATVSLAKGKKRNPSSTHQATT